MRVEGGQKMSVFVHTQGIKTVHAGGWGKKWQNSVHVVFECPLRQKDPNVEFLALDQTFYLSTF